MMDPEAERPTPGAPASPDEPAEGELIPRDAGPYRSPYGWGHGPVPAPPDEAPPTWQHGHWHPDGGGEQPHASSGTAGKVAAAGGIGAMALKVLSAAKFATLGLFKFKIFLSLIVNIGVYALLFGAQMGPLFGIAFATGFVLLILVHETGHLIAARMEGVRATAPFFIPFMGAAIFLQQNPRDARSEAIIGIGGPITGTLGALAVYATAVTVGPATQLGQFFLVLASYGFIINIFNMIPISPLDGGRVLGAVSKWFQLVGLGLVALLVVPELLNDQFPNLILLLVLVVGGIGTYKRFTQPERPGYYDISIQAKAVIGLSYLLLLAVLLGGVLATHQLATADL